jgi:sugar O-acyltransferase (sialic acid O-acetyltransferase NeuD family)
MKKELIIIGCGNVGGFVAYNIQEVGDYKIVGFLDDDPNKHGQSFYGFKVLGSIDNFRDHASNDTHAALAISSPKAKKSILSRLSQFDIHFPNLIFNHVWLSKNVSLGKGNILYPGVSINYESLIGDFVIMNMNCAIGHNATISSYCTLAPGVNLGGFTFIEELVEVGIGVSTRQNIRIGRGAVIGGQSMLVKNVNAGAIVKGVPGKEK